jgi:1-acyl-sn-glycerol-3-phosphate acyltransferase
MAEPIEISEHFIDIEKIFAGKNPVLYKILPKIFFSYLKRIIHQDIVNAAIYKHRDKSGLDFVAAMLDEFGIIVKISSNLTTTSTFHPDPTKILPPIPPAGRYIVAANHPLGGIDGLALIHVSGKVNKNLVFPVNDLLLNIPGLKSLFIPINKHGKNTENIRIIDETFESDKLILYFPAGLVSRKHKGGVIKDLEWKKTFITKAKKYRRDIIPVFISGRNSGFFYNLANLRRKLGIKANIEMLYLTDELVKQKDDIIQLIFGVPISYQMFDKSRSDREWAGFVRSKVYSIGKENGLFHE